MVSSSFSLWSSSSASRSALALNPVLNKKGDAAILRCKEALGADAITTIEPKANGFGTEPADAGGLRGMGCLALSATDLMFVTWAPQKEFRIPRRPSRRSTPRPTTSPVPRRP